MNLERMQRMKLKKNALDVKKVNTAPIQGGPLLYNAQLDFIVHKSKIMTLRYIIKYHALLEHTETSKVPRVFNSV